MQPNLTHADALALLDYRAEAGEFRWRKRRRGVSTEKALGTSNGFGYLRITVLGQSYYAHRLAWFYVHGTWPVSQIDHINGDNTDNRLENLREATPIQNQQNKHKAQKNSASSVLGVSWHKKAEKWQAHICIYKTRKYLGLFKTIEEANVEYQRHKGEVHEGLQKANAGTAQSAKTRVAENRP